jgi:hypothetical protein
VLVLSVLAGLLEAVPLIGPILAAVPAVLVALPLGLGTVALVIGWSMLLQMLENNVLIPRIMSHAVGMSALVGMFAVLAFGTLYGVLGVFIAIPLTAVIQVIFDRLLINTEPLLETPVAETPFDALRVRMDVLRQRARRRLRERETRMGIDPTTGDHLADAADQTIEKAAERVEQLITMAEESVEALEPQRRATIFSELNQTAGHLESAVERVDAVLEKQPEPGSIGADAELTDAELSRATQLIEKAVARGEKSVVSTAQDESKLRHGAGEAPRR